ncbi:MAG: hypothetical protein Q9181_002204 [Wetmoreana brouardii]
MPGSSFKPPAKRGRPAFKTPRPTANSKSARAKPAPRRRSGPATAFASSSASEEDELASIAISDKSADHDEVDTSSDAIAAAPPSTQDAPPVIPPALLVRLLHHHQETTGNGEAVPISKDANKLLGKYMDTFVREAIHRAREERRKAEEADDGLGDGFLEVMRRRFLELEGEIIADIARTG